MKRKISRNWLVKLKLYLKLAIYHEVDSWVVRGNEIELKKKKLPVVG